MTQNEDISVRSTRIMKRRIAATVALSLLSICLAAAPTTQPKPDRFEKDIAAFEAADQKAPPPKDAVMFLGSSSIKRWTSLANDFPGTPVINRGFGGSIVSESVHYAPRIVVPLRPRMIVFYAAENDLPLGHSPKQIMGDVRALVEIIHRDLPETRMLIISIKPSPIRWQFADQMRELNVLLREYVATDPKLDFVDVFTPMLKPDGQPREELFGPDRLHMNKDGYAIWTKLVAPRIAPDRH
jgi:lysophospholipase L1-like esterase